MIVLEAILGVAIVLAGRPLLRLWKHETTRFDQKPRALGWSDEMWCGWVRAMPINLAGAVLLWLVGLLTILGHSTAIDITVVALGAVFLAAISMGATVIYWNHPKVVVPPDRRHQLGVLTARRRKRHGS